MSALLLAMTLIAPLGLALAVASRTIRPAVIRLAPWAAAPALVLATGVAGGPAFVEAKWALLRMQLDGGDALARSFLAFTGLLWFSAAWFARAYVEPRHRSSFWSFFLAAMGANLGVIIAADLASFYLFYSAMTFSVYGLVAHARTNDARRAARVYLAMALTGETLILAAFFFVLREHDNLSLVDVPPMIAKSPHRDLIVALVLAGFGVKVGALPLHVWLPLAHPVAPSPASAVLSATIIKGGLLGWLRFFPLGIVTLPAHGLCCIVAGLLGALYASGVGVTQKDPKTVLAYSSVSQMGLVTALIGVALLAPAIAAAAQAAAVFFAAHHAIAKGSLFLGDAVARTTRRGWRGRLVTAGLVLSALAIAGGPMTSGAAAKVAFSEVFERAPVGSSVLGALLSVATIGSTLLMIRFLSLATPREEAAAHGPRSGLWVPWVFLLVVGSVLLVLRARRIDLLHRLAEPSALWSATWPLLAGVAIAAIARRMRQRMDFDRAAIPPGDVLVLVESESQRLGRRLATTAHRARRALDRALAWARTELRPGGRYLSLAFLDRNERRLRAFDAIGALVLLLLLALTPLLSC